MVTHDTLGRRTTSDQPICPYMFKFVPHRDVARLFPTSFQGYVAHVDQLINVLANAYLYDVWVDAPNGTENRMGTLQSVGSFTCSKWGDERLFFRQKTQRRRYDAVFLVATGADNVCGATVSLSRRSCPCMSTRRMPFWDW